jgi:hypothetical protein
VHEGFTGEGILGYPELETASFAYRHFAGVQQQQQQQCAAVCGH